MCEKNITINEEKQNILFILTDDLGWTDLGCYGSDFYETPNIDKLASEGMKFTSAYSAAPVCSATRASILSGFSPARQHIIDVTPHLRDENYSEKYTDYKSWESPPEYEAENEYSKIVCAKQQGQLPLNIPTFSRYLKNAGYRTGFFGKWHLGPDCDKYPEKFGFDLNVGGNNFGWPPTYFSPYKNNLLTDGEYGEYLTDRLTSEAIKFMHNANNERKPFLCYLPHYAVHTPLEGKPEYVQYFTEKMQKTGVGNNPVYAAMIKSLDDSVGRIMSFLKEENLEENTLIVFFSDNGGLGYPPGYFKKSSLAGYDIVTSLHPLRGFKATLYEGGIRVPCIISQKGKIKPSTNKTPIISNDFLPTILEACNITRDINEPCDGISLMPILEGGEISRDTLTWFFPWSSWLEIYNFDDYLIPSAAILNGDYKLIKTYDGRKMLYNLKKDIGERNDISYENKHLVDELDSLLTSELIKQNAHFPYVNPKYSEKSHKKYIEDLRVQLN